MEAGRGIGILSVMKPPCYAQAAACEEASSLARAFSGAALGVIERQRGISADFIATD
jgi:hypothetical protein